MSTINKKILFLIFLLINLVILLLTSFKVFVKKVDINKIYSTKRENDIFVLGLKSGNNYGVLNYEEDTYYFSKGLFDINSLKIISPYKTRKNVIKKNNNEYKIIIYCDNYYQIRTIKIVDIPILSIKTEKLIPTFESSFYYNLTDINRPENSEYYNINIHLSDNDTNNKFDSYGTIFTNGMMRIRGATSSEFPKKSYKIELNNKVSLLEMNADSDWILDAVYTDKSKIRNLLSYNIWNMINDNQAINNDQKGEFVELYIDNNYIGLYVLKEKIDKEITCNSPSCFLAKSVGHVKEETIDKILNNKIYVKEIENELYLENYELKKYNDAYLKKFIEKMKNYYSQNTYTPNNSYNIKNYINYNLFIIFIYGTDNITKNQYLSISDKTPDIFITPWDLDLTFGIDYSTIETLKSKEIYDNYNNNLWIEENFINHYDRTTKEQIKERYWELRKDVITMDTINNYLDSYKELLVSSGAAKRDSDRWYYYDIEQEIEKIRTWANNRITFLDEYFKI